MEDYQEIKLNKFREVVIFSLFFISFFSGELFLTNEFFGWVKIKQQKIKYRYKYFNEWYYRDEWTPWRFKWVRI